MNCGLCGGNEHQLFYTQTRGTLQGREYWHCATCDLVHVPRHQHLSPQDEKAIYDFHQNDLHDEGYRKFLDRVAEPLQQRLPKGAQGLDFGSGPGPTLSVMMSASGYPCTTYDIYYDHYPERLETQYDYLTCTEVIEHVAEPAKVLQQLLVSLRPGGLLALMTQQWRSQEHFEFWSYANDPTHISFFHQRTFDWIAKHWRLDVNYAANDVIIFRVPT